MAASIRGLPFAIKKKFWLVEPAAILEEPFASFFSSLKPLRGSSETDPDRRLGQKLLRSPWTQPRTSLLQSCTVLVVMYIRFRCLVIIISCKTRYSPSLKNKMTWNIFWEIQSGKLEQKQVWLGYALYGYTQREGIASKTQVEQYYYSKRSYGYIILIGTVGLHYHFICENFFEYPVWLVSSCAYLCRCVEIAYEGHLANGIFPV